ncbi:methyltransferase domain-containing protein [Ruegeria pomeroyi]|uniref:methyltransferase domain-containing protein n=1 Tax=Ruegeria pomeroyi TaxID=89184 RepID=UPI00192ACE50|nr:methyltransferase domain-containing protein [Ruegeria pomeroyi]QWV09090.1 methyltransferase domain-containing protein [Ruegeria pomeroyi]
MTKTTFFDENLIERVLWQFTMKEQRANAIPATCRYARYSANPTPTPRPVKINESDRTMNFEEKIATHYGHGNLTAAIRSGLQAQGITPEQASVEDLGPVDEFHIGGRAATVHFFDQIDLSETSKALDIGCGLGGAARYAAHSFGSQIEGIDLTPEYVETGGALCQWVGLSDKVNLSVASALSMPFESGDFDIAYMMHVGMNIEDKRALFKEVARVLKPGGTFAIYDIMRSNDEDLVYPVPWASSAETCCLAGPATYRAALEEGGFVVRQENDRRDFAIDFFEKMKKANAGQKSPPPLGLHVLMQQTTAEKIPNMIANLQAGRIKPVEIYAVKQ